MLAVPRAVVVGSLLFAVVSLAAARNGGGRVLDGPLTITSPEGPTLCLQSPAASSNPVTGFQVEVGSFFSSTANEVIGGDIAAMAYLPDDAPDATAVGLDVFASSFPGGGDPGMAYGVRAQASGSDCAEAVGVDGVGFSDVGTGGAFCGIGVRGTTYFTGSLGFGVFSNGDFGATGSKSFLQPHPSDPSLAIRFSALEGNESGTYFRGTAELVGGRAELPIPESWRLASEADGITVQLTAVGANLGLYVVEQSRERIVVGGERDGTFHFLVNGLRRGYADHEDLVENRFFRPSVRGVPFGTQYPPALREVLIENGILNPDGTPNEATARAMGWELRDPEEVPVARRWWLSVAERRELLRGSKGVQAQRLERTGG